MNEEELLKQLQQYFLQNRIVDRQYDPNQGKVWTDSYSLPNIFNDVSSEINRSTHAGPNNMWDQNAMTLQRLLAERTKKYSM